MTHEVEFLSGDVMERHWREDDSDRLTAVVQRRKRPARRKSPKRAEPLLTMKCITAKGCVTDQCITQKGCITQMACITQKGCTTLRRQCITGKKTCSPPCFRKGAPSR